MKSKLDWKGVGQFMAALVKLTTTIIATMKEVGAGVDIIEWLNSAGRTEFVSALKKLGELYKKSVPVPTPVKTKSGRPYVIHSAKVDLSVKPDLPFSGATIESNLDGDKETLVELRSDDNLYVNDRKVILHIETGQRNGVVRGHVLREALTGKPVVNAALLDFLTKNQQFIPNHWKFDEQGCTHYIFFWGTIYRYAGGDLYVRCLCWNGDGWSWNYDWLDYGWGSGSPAAVLAS